MSSNLRISFDMDMPAANVEIVAPDMKVVDRVMLEAGRSKTVQVPSESSFLRVHLPSGDVVRLDDPGNLSRVISIKSILDQTKAASPMQAASAAPVTPTPVDFGMFENDESVQDLPDTFKIDQYHMQRSWVQPAAPGHDEILPLAQYGTARIISADRGSIQGVSVSRGREAHWEIGESPRSLPLVLQIDRSCGSILEVRLPGDSQRIWVRADLLRDQNTITYSVRISTREPTADMIVGYLQRGDIYSAEAMKEWIEEAEEMLLYKKNDPYAAAVGAYLLLRLKDFSHLHNWAKNLADGFEFLSDGCVIWAWQLIHQYPSRTNEFRDYFKKAADRGLPVYTEGLRLLVDGLRLLGDEGKGAHEEILKKAGVVLWDSPLTATVRTTDQYNAGTDTLPVVYNIQFAARV